LEIQLSEMGVVIPLTGLIPLKPGPGFHTP